jgi:Putative transcription activator
MKYYFSSIATLSIDPIMQAIYRHEFFAELGKGNLPEEKFVFYVQQGSLLLASYARAFALISAKLQNESDSASLLYFANQRLLAARELHGFFIKEYRIAREESKAPACQAYCSHLLERAALGSAAEGMASVLPCFWVYRQIGLYAIKQAGAENPYSKWIEHYSSKEYEQLVDKSVELTDRLASEVGDEERRRMFEAFIISSRYNYCFWDDAYHVRTWPI